MVAGDLVNTASRLQSVAPPGAVLVGESTHQASSGAIAYEPAGEQLLKGKVAPVAAWRALRVVAERRGRGRDERLEAPFVGRDAELRLLKDLFHATAREKRVRLVSITGQAGIGKSRLAWEFLKYVDGVVEQVWWHEGRSPSYGEGITFWALGEMVRSRAGLLESDDAATTRAKIAEVLDANVPDETERRRIEPALLALLGAGEAPPGGATELFSAWRTFFERLAGTGVVALLFEDLHWADPGTLDFIEHILEWSRNVPILIITLARPELLDTTAGLGRRQAVLPRPRSPAARRGVDARPARRPRARPAGAGGPVDRRARRGHPAVRRRDDPDARRRRAAPPARRRRVRARRRARRARRPGHAPCADRRPARRARRRRPRRCSRTRRSSASRSRPTRSPRCRARPCATLEPRLAGLVRSDLLHVEIDPRSPERGQYAFVQALIREVAYSTLALRDRRTRHLAAARYFESIGDDELAGALAAHYLAAYKASTEGAEAEALAGQARIALRAAAERAARLGSPGQAVAFLEQAIAISTDSSDILDLHERATTAAISAARNDLALSHRGRRPGAGPLPRSAVPDRVAHCPPCGCPVRAAATRGRADLDGGRAGRARRCGRGRPRHGRPPRKARLLLPHRERVRAGRPHARECARPGRAPRPDEVAAEALLHKGTSAFYQGRLWEARALARGRPAGRRSRAVSRTPSCESCPCCRRSPRSTTLVHRSRSSARRSSSPGTSARERASSGSCSTWSRMHAGPATGTGRVRSSRPRSSSTSTTRRWSGCGCRSCSSGSTAARPRRRTSTRSSAPSRRWTTATSWRGCSTAGACSLIAMVAGSTPGERGLDRGA